MKVSVHWNLHRLVWSIKEGKLPIRHTDRLALAGVTFHVWEKSRLKMVAAQCRAVHAFAVGQLVSQIGPTLKQWRQLVEVHYNPYRCGHFTLKDGSRVDTLLMAFFYPDGTLWGILDG